MGRSLLRGKDINFTRMRPGLYQSSGYDGGSRMLHKYRIWKFGDEWMLAVDLGHAVAFPTLKAAKERATSIERSEENNERK
jgi:hypothetical protein